MAFKFKVNDRVSYQGDTGTVMDVGTRDRYETDFDGTVKVTAQQPVYLIQLDYVAGETPPDGISVFGDDDLTAA